MSKELKKYPLNNSKIINLNGKRYRSFSTEDQSEKRKEEEERDIHTRGPLMKKQKADAYGGYVVQRVPFFVGNNNIGRIIGTKGSTKKRMERDSSCKIIVPPRDIISHYIEIEGFNNESIEKCKSLISKILPNKEPPKTHFLSLRIRKCRAIFEKFQKQLCQEFGGEICHPLMCISPFLLHITLQVLSIRSPEMLERVKRVMNERIQPFIDNEFKKESSECYIQYCALGTFPENNPKFAKVLWFQPTHTASIEKLVKHINTVFVDEKIIDKEQEVCLHSTIMNVKYFRRNRGRQRNSYNKIDSREILKKYGDLKGTAFEGKKLQFKTLQLNVLGGESNRADKYYKHDHKLFFYP